MYRMRKRIKFLKWLKRFQTGIFGCVMSLAGLSRAFTLSESVFQIDKLFSTIVGLFAIIVFIILFLILILKLIFLSKQMIRELHDFEKGCLYGTVTISIVLLSNVIQPYSIIGYRICWISGALSMFVLTYFTIYRSLSVRRHPEHFVPAMILPAVGVLDITATGAHIGYIWSQETMLFAFAIGVVLTLVFFPLIFSRIVHEVQMSHTAEPTMMIMLGPFGVMFMAYYAITQKVDLFSGVLFYFGLFLFSILIFRVLRTQRSFIYSWWSIGFPTASLTISSLIYVQAKPDLLTMTVAGALLFLLSSIIGFMLFKSICLLWQKRLFNI